MGWWEFGFFSVHQPGNTGAHIKTQTEVHTQHRACITEFTWVWLKANPAALFKMETSVHERLFSDIEQHSLGRSSRYTLHPIKMTHPHCQREWVHSVLSTCEGGHHRVRMNSSASSQVHYVRLNSVLRWMPLLGGGGFRKQNNVFPHGFQKKKLHKTGIYSKGEFHGKIARCF